MELNKKNEINEIFTQLVFDWKCMSSTHICEVSRQSVVQQKFSKARWLPRLGVHIFIRSKFSPARENPNGRDLGILSLGFMVSIKLLELRDTILLVKASESAQY